MTLFGTKSRSSYRVSARSDRDGTRTIEVNSFRSGRSRGGASQATSAAWESVLQDRKKLKGAEAAIRAVMNDVKRRYDQVKEQEAKLQVEASALSTRQSDFNERRSQAMQVRPGKGAGGEATGG